MKKKLMLIGSAAVIFLSGCSAEPYNKSFFALDSVVSVTVYPADEQLGGKLSETVLSAEECFKKVCGDDRSVPLTREDAERINSVLYYAEELNDTLDGRLELYCGGLTSLWGISGDTPKIPDESDIAYELEKLHSLEPFYVEEGGSGYVMLDLGSAAKGYACDMVYDTLSGNMKNGYAVISAGSSSLLYGEKEGGFSVKVRSPDTEGGILGSFVCGEGFISTSGGYERFFEAEGSVYAHILDPETGYPVETDLVSVTVYCPIAENNGLLSDMLSTMIYIDGTAGLEKYAEYAERENIGIIAADNKGTVYSLGIDFKTDGESGYRLWNES